MIYTEKVRIAKLWPHENRTSKSGSEYPFRQVLFEKEENGYTDKLYFELVGQDTDDLFNAKEGDEVELRYRPDCHEYNGRWYTRLKAHSIRNLSQQRPQPVPRVEDPDEGKDDLPF